MSDFKIEVAKPFGPSMAKVKIPDPIIKSLNEYIDEIVENKKKLQELDYGKELVGDVTQEFKLEKEIMEKSGWTKFLAACVSKWIELDTKQKVTQFKLRTSWVVRQYQNEYNPIHWHNGHISGAGFLKLPKSFGDHTSKNKDKNSYRGGDLNFIYGNRHFLSSSVLTIKPQVGDFYFFPNYLMHTVYPFKGTDEERRSISFNADIDEKFIMFMKMHKQKNVLGEYLEDCSKNPLTGWYRDGCCNTDENDHGFHTVCAKVTTEFLEWCKDAGNDLITPHPEFGFPGLKDGDGWCVCASWYAKAVEAGKGCPIYLKSTHENTLKILPIETLKKFAIDIS